MMLTLADLRMLALCNPALVHTWLCLYQAYIQIVHALCTIAVSYYYYLPISVEEFLGVQK